MPVEPVPTPTRCRRRRWRRLRALAVGAPIVALLALPACGDDRGRPVLPAVTGAFGSEAEIRAPTGPPGDELVVETLQTGEGRAVRAGDLVVTHYLAAIWRGNQVFHSSFDAGRPEAFPVGVGRVVEGWDEGLTGVRVGSRVLLVIPPRKAYGPRGGEPRAGIRADDTLVYVVDVLGAHGPDETARGTGVRAVAGSGDLRLPGVTGGVGERPSVEIPSAESPPTRLVARTLIRGEGRRVSKGDLTVVQYAGWTWQGRKFDMTWERGLPAAVPIGVGRVVKGWDEGLTGATVGSRVLLVIPPGKAYGDKGQPDAGIEGGDTLVFVVDVLAAY